MVAGGEYFETVQILDLADDTGSWQILTPTLEYKVAEIPGLLNLGK